MTTIRSKSALIFQIFSKLNEIKQIVHDFWLSFTIKNEQIEPNLAGVFANKYYKIRCWLRNFEYFWEFSNSLISLLRIFICNWSIRKSYLHFGIRFRSLRKSSKLPSIFLGFRSIQSVNRILKPNGKKEIFVII